MRTIRFRAKQTYNNEWVIGNLIYKEAPKRVLENKEPYRNYYIQSQDFTGNLYEVIPETIGQFTGLYDKNGKEIYEGDLFRIKDTYHSSGLLRHSFKRDTIFEVVYDKTGFVLKVVKSDTQHMGNCIGSFQIGDLIYFEGKEHEIIGNIHENPELLEK